MNKLLAIYKPQGITPFQLIKNLRSEKPEYNEATIGYAGRLDPLAHGVLLLMIDDANKQRETFIGLEKTYEFSVLFGLSTDSYDYLGLFTKDKYTAPPKNLEEKIQEFITKHTGEIIQTYPPFSSKTIGGKTLFKLAKKKQLVTEELPKREVVIRNFSLKKIETVPSKQIEKIMFKNLRLIKGYFRQTKTIQQWKNYFQEAQEEYYTRARFSITCSSGTYVRGLANEMGEKFECGAIAFEIFRTRVGNYTIKEALTL